jgi:site-specific recombinase XerD
MQKLIDEYMEWKHGKTSISDEWDKNNRHLLSQFLSYLKVPADQVTTSHLVKAVAAIRKNKNYKQNYQRQLINAGKSFGLWLAKSNSNIDAKEIEEIQLPKNQWKTKRAEDMLSPEEVSLIIQTARNPRDKALLAMLYDGSNRPIELLRLKWSDIIEDEFGAFFITDAKTDKERRIRLTNISLGYLAQWKKKHPDPRPDQYVFCTINESREGKGIRPVSIDNLQRLVKNIRRDTGIKKLKPSIFRPTKITHDVSAGYELPYIMKKNWGHLRTNMIDLYTNLDSTYLDEVALRHAGMKRTEDMKKKNVYKVVPPVCPACQTVNLIGSHFCAKCMQPLTEEAKGNVQDTTHQLRQLFVENPKAQTLFYNLLAELKKQPV